MWSSNPRDRAEPADQILCGGRNFCNQVDDTAGASCNGANTINAYDPVPLSPALPGSVVSMQGGQDHVCAQIDDGRVFCWGGRSGYNLGTQLTDIENIFPPTEVSILGEIEEPIVELGVGDVHMCGRSASGRLWCWGEDGDKQLGVGVEGDVDRLLEVDLACPGS